MKVDYYFSFSILLCKQMKSIPKPMTRIIICFENQQHFRSNVFDFNVKKVDTIILRSTCYNSTADPKATKSEKLSNQHRIVAIPVSWYQMVLLRKHKQTKTTKQFLPSFDFLFTSASSSLQARPPFTPTRPLNNEKTFRTSMNTLWTYREAHRQRLVDSDFIWKSRCTGMLDRTNICRAPRLLLTRYSGFIVSIVFDIHDCQIVELVPTLWRATESCGDHKNRYTLGKCILMALPLARASDSRVSKAFWLIR